MSYEDRHGMPDPDWNRYVLHQPSAPNLPPVGDPIKWSGRGRVDFRFDQPELFSEQLVIAAAKDMYARPWSVIGELSLPASAWDRPSGYPYPDPAELGFNVLLDIILGLGQIQLSQRILLMSGNDPARGLCNQQAAANGGPYGQTSRPMPEQPFSAYIQRPFAAIGAIVANTVAIRLVVQPGMPTEWPPVFASLLVGPLAAGSQL